VYKVEDDVSQKMHIHGPGAYISILYK